MSEQPSREPRRGLVALAPYGSMFGLIAILALVVTRLGLSGEGALDLSAALLALAVGFTVFSGLWWAVSSDGLGDFAAWWRADDPTAHVHVPIWGTASLLSLAYLLLFRPIEARIGLFGLIFLTGVIQLVVLVVVARHLARRLDRDMTETQVDWTLNWAFAATGVPLALFALAVLALQMPILTGAPNVDAGIFVIIFLGMFAFLPYFGFAIVYGAGDAVRHAWPRWFRRPDG